MALTLSDMGLLCCKSGIFFLFSHMASEQGRPIIPLMWGSPHGLTTSHSLVPYHYSTGSRVSVLELWQDTHIHTISYVTVKLLLLSWGMSDLKLLFSEVWWEEIKCLSQRPVLCLWSLVYLLLLENRALEVSTGEASHIVFTASVNNRSSPCRSRALSHVV